MHRAVKTAKQIEMPFGLLSRVDSKNHVLDGGPEKAIFRGRTCPGMPDDTLLQLHGAKTTEPIEMPFGCGLRWAEGSMCYMGAH